MTQYLDNPTYRITDTGGYCFDKYGNFIKKSNDAFYLFTWFCDIPKIYGDFYYINEKVIPFITHFKTGVHAYSGIYSMILNIIENDIDVSDYKIAVNKYLQKGVLDIIYIFFEKEKIIFLDVDVTYKFDKLLLVENSLHSFLENLQITERVSDLIISKIEKKDTLKKRVSIIKTDKNYVTSAMGVTEHSRALEYCLENDLYMLDPNELGEKELISYINNCEYLVLTWGTTFMKNFIYISDKCLTCKVFVIGKEFEHEYTNAIERNILVRKYKNCVFEYELNPII